ncbi:MAG: BREX system Lon protease-like protein BrxL [Candidatus Cloacimonetes bacterium]|nr:BREX system Lon protease-like protein BrxL [Candidatus Cloacimonadota bacterium]
MTTLDAKIKEHFPEESIYKSPDRYNVFSGKILPSFIKDWLIKRYTNSNGNLDSNALLNFMEEHIPLQKNNLKSKLRTHREEMTILTRFIVENDIRNDVLKFSIPDLGIKPNEGRIPDYIAKKHPELKDGEVWGVISLVYIPPLEKEKGVVELIKFKPFKPYEVDLEYFKNARSNFSLEEWIDVLIRAMEYNPDFNEIGKGFDSLTKKLLFISRLLVFVEPNLNVMELAPKGTGKSYIFGNISKYGWMFSGGVVSRAKLLYDIQKKTSGIIENYDFVTMDEIETIKFSNENELQGALKNYLESGKFSIANYNGISSAGLMLLGNIPLSSSNQPISNRYFTNLPSFFQSSALLDRFHGFIEGWKLIRINEDLILKGQTLNVEYFSEILHSLRNESIYSYIVGKLIKIPKGSDTRDVKAVIRLSTAYLKLLFPHITSISDINKNEFYKFCLIPALEKRRIIKRQISLIDSEFDENIPDIKLNDYADM